MADTPITTAPTPIDPSVVQSVQDYNEATARASINLSSFNKLSDESSNALNLLRNTLSSAGVSLQNVNNLVGDQANKFGLLTTSIIGARESFRSFTGIDASRVTSFTDQTKDLIKTLTTEGTALNIVNEAKNKTINMLSKMGLGMGAITSAMQMGSKELAAYAKNVLLSADNQLYFGNAIIQSAAQAGNLEKLYSSSGEGLTSLGDDLSGLTEILGKQQLAIADAMKATGIIDEDKMSKYAISISQLPGGLEALAKGTTLAGKSTNILTAAIQYAQGSGRDYTKVTEDMRKAILDYGVSVDDALKFTARITEISNKYGAQVEDVRAALMNSADAFKMFTAGGAGAANMTQSMSDVMNDYLSSLNAAGVPMQNAIEMFKTMSGAMSGMRVEQKAFLSAQTGGPGGLMGAFQIDKMLKEGDFKGVYEKVQSQMRRQLGSIVTVDEASRSPQAALQMERQIQLLRQGPLGSMAKTDVDAERLLEAMQKGTAPQKPEDLKKATDESLRKTIERGSKWEEPSYTVLGEIAINTARFRLGAGIANFGTIGNATSARGGSAGGADQQGRGTNTKLQESLQSQKNNVYESNNQGSLGSTAMNQLGSLVNRLPEATKSVVSNLEDSLTEQHQETINETKTRMNKSIDEYKKTHNINNAFTPLDSDFTPAGKQVGQSIATPSTNSTSTNRQINNTGSNMNLNSGPIPVTLAGNTTLKVEFHGTCPHCQRPINEHAAATNATSTK